MIYLNQEVEENNRECALCLEVGKYKFYDYKYPDNKFIHNCNCTPHIHYNCFKLNYKKKHSCIICLEQIDKMDNKCEYFIIYFKISKLKYLFMGLILLSLLYSFLNIDYIIIDKNMLNENDFI